MVSLKICKDIKSLNEEIHQKKLQVMKLKSIEYYQIKVGFVPTMGYLHRGHISLVEKAKEENDIVVASIFINPTQFNANEDLSSYPVDLVSDEKLLNSVGTDLLFLPTPDIMYPKGFSTYVQVESMSEVLESKSRPGHFRGVATVVTKLLLIVKPSNLYIGQKDAMQCICISRLVQDLNIDCTVHICDTVRESSGLAKSSRNSYLDADEQQEASRIYQTLLDCKNKINSFNDRSQLITYATEILESNKNIKVEYISLASPENGLEILDQFPPPPSTNLSIALFFNGLKRRTRLIDVIIL